jgi:hypothetical protein
MVTILVVLVVLMLLGAIPTWPHSRSWGYGPSGGLGIVSVEPGAHDARSIDSRSGTAGDGPAAAMAATFCSFNALSC